jgi:hypothetical protein
VIVGLAVFLLIRNQPIADPRLFLVLRVVVSFSVAALGAIIPRFLELGWRGQGLAIRAGGSLALFVLTFVYTPDLVTGEGGSGPQIRQKSTGEQSLNIIANTARSRSMAGAIKAGSVTREQLHWWAGDDDAPCSASSLVSDSTLSAYAAGLAGAGSR